MFCNIYGLLDNTNNFYKTRNQNTMASTVPTVTHLFSRTPFVPYTAESYLFHTTANFHCSTQPELTYPLQLYDNKLIVCMRFCGVSRMRMNGVVRHALQECKQAESV